MPTMAFKLIEVPWQARIQDLFQRGARKNAENQGHSSIELEMSKQYIDELRGKRASNFEAIGMYKTVWNYDMHATN